MSCDLVIYLWLSVVIPSGLNWELSPSDTYEQTSVDLLPIYFNRTSPKYNQSAAAGFCRRRGMKLPGDLEPAQLQHLISLTGSDHPKIWLSYRRKYNDTWQPVDKPGNWNPEGEIQPDKRCSFLKLDLNNPKPWNQSCYTGAGGFICFIPDCPMCPPWSCHLLQNGCLLIRHQSLTWFQARAACIMAGGQLWVLDKDFKQQIYAWRNLSMNFQLNDAWIGWRAEDWVEEGEGLTTYPLLPRFTKQGGGTDHRPHCVVLLTARPFNWTVQNCSDLAAVACVKDNKVGLNTRLEAPSTPSLIRSTRDNPKGSLSLLCDTGYHTLMAFVIVCCIIVVGLLVIIRIQCMRLKRRTSIYQGEMLTETYCEITGEIDSRPRQPLPEIPEIQYRGEQVYTSVPSTLELDRMPLNPPHIPCIDGSPCNPRSAYCVVADGSCIDSVIHEENPLYTSSDIPDEY